MFLNLDLSSYFYNKTINVIVRHVWVCVCLCVLDKHEFKWYPVLMLWAQMFLDDVLSKTSTWHNVSFENMENNLQMSYVPFSLSLKEAISTRSSTYV